MAKIILISLLVVGVILRWFNLTESMSFFYDQARDALAAQKILSWHLVLVGPTTDMVGLFFGPVWYYFLAFLYFISFGHPAIVLRWVSLFDLASIILIYLVGKKIFDQKVGLVAAFFWTIGALPVAYARTLANPSTTAFWTLLAVWSLLQVADNKKKYVIVAVVITSLLFQFNAAGAFFFLFFVLVALVSLRDKLPNKKLLILGLLFAMVLFLPQIFFDLRHEFLGTKSILKIFLNNGPKADLLAGFIMRWENLKMELTNYTFFGHQNLSLLATFFGSLLVFKIKNKYKNIFLFWLFIPLFVYFFLYLRSVAHPFYLLTWVPSAVLVVSYLTVKIGKIFWPALIIVLAVFAMCNFSGLKREIFLKDHIAQPADPNRIGLADQLRVIDFLYTSAQGAPFGYFSYNITPYWADHNFQYLFFWYGKNKYGYEPSRNSGEEIYVIYEPEPYLGENFLQNWLKQFHGPEWSKTPLKENIGVYTIEKYVKKQS